MRASPDSLGRLATEAAPRPDTAINDWQYPVPITRSRIRSQAPVRQRGSFVVEHRGKHWAVLDVAGQLVCLTVYKRGAEEVIRRLAESNRLPGGTSSVASVLGSADNVDRMP